MQSCGWTAMSGSVAVFGYCKYRQHPHDHQAPSTAADTRMDVRRGGERLQPDVCRPRRTLRNLLQETGIPPWERDRLLLLYHIHLLDRPDDRLITGPPHIKQEGVTRQYSVGLRFANPTYDVSALKNNRFILDRLTEIHW
jgi:tRNA(Ile)-lysidine synthetase-like protein